MIIKESGYFIENIQITFKNYQIGFRTTKKAPGY